MCASNAEPLLVARVDRHRAERLPEGAAARSSRTIQTPAVSDTTDECSDIPRLVPLHAGSAKNSHSRV